MKRRVFVTLGLVLLQALPWGATARAATGAEVRAVSVVADETGAALSVNLTAKVAYKLEGAKNPTRVIITLRHTRAAPGLVVPAAQGVLTALSSQQQGGDLRLTLRLAHSLPARLHWDSVGAASSVLVMRLDEASVAPARAVQAAHQPRQSGRDIVIAVDAGHGGDDPGAIGHAGACEKDVVLAIARALERRIDAEPGMHAVLTRDRDQFLTLRERIARARAAKADLFISIHADSITNRTVSGSSVYVLSERGASNEAARWLAERENAADLMGGVSLADKGNTLASVLLDLSQSANLSASMTAATSVLGALEGVAVVRKSQVQQAGFVVLKSPDIPSMLVETAYISNPAEEKRLRNPGQQAALAAAIFNGLHAYFAGNPPSGTRFAQARGARDAAGVPGA